ncbi:Clp protease ClpP [Hymenobacter sp. BRD128]|uniref:Clp protease ClpP n=1 Tax=Hymenobacter sp. BRD128 TaxID=2675878 RepID=UPI001565B1CB|nr:Clp protease ClpP [Hymenobacter sp. BRD128]QKG56996.1 Clp protease ClpP [Hymenobacter sp. BRD128]
MAQPTLQIYSAIGVNAQDGTGLSAAQFGAQLAQAEATGEKRVAVRINSGGGNWQEGQSMYDLLKASALKVDTYCVGLVASAATLPFMAGNKRLIAAHGKLMIHECASVAQGQVADLENAIAQQKAINDSMAQLYASVSGQTVEKCAELMKATTYLDSEQAVALGFATGIMPDTQATQAPPADMPAASLHSYYATILSAADMKNLLIPIFAAAGMLTVTASTSDADVATAVQAAFTEKDKAKKEADEAKAALATATAALAAAEKKCADMEEEDAKAKAEAATAAVTALVKSAVSAGKITASMEATYTTLATADLASTKAVLDAMPARKSIAGTITNVEASADTKVIPLTAGGAMAEIQARLAGATI